MPNFICPNKIVSCAQIECAKFHLSNHKGLMCLFSMYPIMRDTYDWEIERQASSGAEKMLTAYIAPLENKLNLFTHFFTQLFRRGLDAFFHASLCTLTDILYKDSWCRFFSRSQSGLTAALYSRPMAQSDPPENCHLTVKKLPKT